MHSSFLFWGVGEGRGDAPTVGGANSGQGGMSFGGALMSNCFLCPEFPIFLFLTDKKMENSSEIVGVCYKIVSSDSPEDLNTCSV